LDQIAPFNQSFIDLNQVKTLLKKCLATIDSMKQNKSLKLEGLSGQLSLNDEKITYIKTA
jgi:hypothetical protein